MKLAAPAGAHVCVVDWRCNKSEMKSTLKVEEMIVSRSLAADVHLPAEFFPTDQERRMQYADLVTFRQRNHNSGRASSVTFETGERCSAMVILGLESLGLRCTARMYLL